MLPPADVLPCQTRAEGCCAKEGAAAAASGIERALPAVRALAAGVEVAMEAATVLVERLLPDATAQLAGGAPAFAALHSGARNLCPLRTPKYLKCLLSCSSRATLRPATSAGVGAMRTATGSRGPPLLMSALSAHRAPPQCWRLCRAPSAPAPGRLCPTSASLPAPHFQGYTATCAAWPSATTWCAWGSHWG